MADLRIKKKKTSEGHELCREQMRKSSGLCSENRRDEATPRHNINPYSANVENMVSS